MHAVSKNNMWASHGLDRFCVRPYSVIGPELQVRLRLNYAFHINGQSDSSLKRIIPEPHVPSRGSQARGTRLITFLIKFQNDTCPTSFPGNEVDTCQRSPEVRIPCDTKQSAIWRKIHICTYLICDITDVIIFLACVSSPCLLDCLCCHQSRTQSMPVRRLGHAQHLTCERAYSGYEIVLPLAYRCDRPICIAVGKEDILLQQSGSTINSHVFKMEFKLSVPVLVVPMWKCCAEWLYYYLKK